MTTDKPLRLCKKELLCGDILFQETLICTEGMPPQQNVCDLWEIALVPSGNGVCRCCGQLLPCKQGDIYIFPPEVPHGFGSAEEGHALTVRRLLLDLQDWTDSGVSTPGDPRYCYGAFHDNAVFAYAMLNTKTQQEVLSLLDAIAFELHPKRPEWRDAVRAHLTLLLITVGRYVSNAIQRFPRLKDGEWHAIAPAIRAVTERFSDSDLTLGTVASDLFISPSRLSRLFKRLSGKTFSEYLKDVRYDHACKLLRETDLTVDRIVQQCGLRDIPSFYAGFHAHTGMTPTRFRNTYTSPQETRNQMKTGDKIMIILSEISENLQKGKSKLVKEMVQQALDEGSNPEQILNEGLLAGMSVIGEKFKNNEVYVPEVLVAARAMNMGVQVLKPHLAAQGVQATGRVCLGTVQGDLHDIGKNLVKMMMEGKGLEVIDLGTDVPAESFIQTAIEQNCSVICCSALLTTTMPVMESVVKAAEAAGIRDKVKIMIGGAPVSQEYCDKIGADCYTVDAASAADAAVEFCKA